MFTRRQFGCSLIAVPFALRATARGLAQTSSPPLFDLNGVRIGLETFSFHDLPPAGDPALLPTLIGNMREVGIGECEIMSGHVEPFASVSTGWWVQSRRAPGYQEMRDAARRWRLTTPLEYYVRVQEQFAAAGLRIHLYNVNFNETFTDAERDRTFEAAKALGVAGFSSSTVISEARRLVPFVERHQMFVAMHNHNNLVDPDQFATPQSFETALALSPWFKVTLDIGHFTAGNNDPVSFIAKWRPDRQHSCARPEAQQRSEPAVRKGRHADRRGAAADQGQRLSNPRGRAVYVLNHCHFCHGVDLTRSVMGATDLMRSGLVAADVDGSLIGPVVRAGKPNLVDRCSGTRDHDV